MINLLVPRSRLLLATILLELILFAYKTLGEVLSITLINAVTSLKPNGFLFPPVFEIKLIPPEAQDIINAFKPDEIKQKLYPTPLKFPL